PDAVWVSPHDHSLEVAQLLEELGVHDFPTLFRTPVGDATGLSVLATRAWDVSGVGERYDAFQREFAPYMPLPARAQLSDTDAFVVRTRLVHLFRGFPPLDPELPDELAPLRGHRARAVATFHALYEGLAQPAQRHF